MEEFSFTAVCAGICVIMLVVMASPELIYALFFKVFKPENKGTLGICWKLGMAYATSPGSLYSRYQMTIIALAPFVVLSLLFTALYFLKILSIPIYILLATLHAASCVGDFFYVYLICWKYRKERIVCKDTETGLIIYENI